MKYTQLGNTGIEVSRICVGCMSYVAEVAEVAERLGVTMTEVALAWLLKRGVAAPIVGATKVPHFNDAVRALDLDLSDEDAAYLEEPYKAHEVVGAL